jgi:hypothetical protein
MTKLEEAALAFAKADRAYGAAALRGGSMVAAESARAALYEAGDTLYKVVIEFADEVAADAQNQDEDDRPGLG